MNKYLLIIVLLLIGGQSWAQNKSSILHVIKSDDAHNMVVNGVPVLKVYRGVFQQGTTVLSSDSAYLYQKENAIDAFGHVIITQGDTLHVFGDKLNYQGNTKMAIMTDNVRLIDKDAVLTTNYFTYNTATKYGTYTGGGKLVNKDNTLTSKNGYYLAASRDAYFRYDVVLNTADAIIKNDTLRYNSGSRIAYFYGPTNIYGKKDKDTLYTENGTYNTQTEQAFFGKNNLYKQNTKTLKGDSLFYDRLAGYGRAVKHVTFRDSEQKVILHGDLGETFKKGNRTMMTQHPYVVFVTEERDTTKTNGKDTLAAKTGIVKKPVLGSPKNTMPVVDASQIKNAKANAQAILSVIPQGKKDSVAKQMSAAANNARDMLSTIPQAKKDSLAKRVSAALVKKPALAPPLNTMPLKDGPQIKLGKNLVTNNFTHIKKDSVLKKDTILKDTTHIKRDSIFMTADTIETYIITYKELRVLQYERLLAGLRDTSVKAIPSIVYTKPVKHIDMAVARIRSDTTVFHHDYFKRKSVARDTLQHKVATAPVPKKPARPVIKTTTVVDSVNLSQQVTLSDTARVRILVAAHHAKIFKSDLQAKADSIFFSYADSVARMYYKPMIWVQDSQLSADTVNLQMRRKQLDNIELYPSAFIVNIEKRDSTHFNQVAGKKMRGYFKNSKMDKMFVFGNAETNYFDRDSGKVTQLHHTISSKIRVRFKSNEPLDILWYVKPDAKITPIGMIKEENKILKGFVWKPEERPVSKEAIINPTVNKPVVKKVTNKPDVKKPPAKPDEKNNLKPNLKAGADSVKLKADTALLHNKTKQDTVPRIKPKTDTIKNKQHEPAKQ